MELDSRQSFQYLSQFLAEITNPQKKTPIVPIVAQILSCPVVFVDESFHVMDESRFDLEEDVWDQLLSSKQKQFWHPPKKYNQNGYAVTKLKSKIGDYSYEIIYPIYQDNSANILQGAIYLLSPVQELPKDYTEILKFISFSLSWVMWRHVRQSQNSSASQNKVLIRLLLDMLYGNPPSEEERKRILKSCFYKTDQDFILLVIESSASFDEDYSIEKLTADVNTIFPDSITLCFSGDVLILVPFRYRLEEEYAPFWEKLSSVLKRHKCYCGISTAFHSIDEYFLNHFVRALSAARVARETKHEKHYIHYVDESLYDFIANGPPPFNIKTLCNPSLLKLVEHDKKYNSEYFYTLMCYWQLDRDTPRICRYMHIHKNTLYYRLSKIRTLLNRDIDNHATIIELNFSITIMEYLEMIPRYRIYDELSMQKKMTSDAETSENTPASER